MTASRHGRRAGLMSCAAAALLLLSGCTGTAAPEAGPPAATTTAASPSAAAVPSQPAAPTAGQPPVLDPSAPASLAIPSLGTETSLLHLGLREDGSLDVPPEAPGSPASWYTGSPTPGERGPSVLLGHVNATGGGEGVFAGLRALKPGDRLEVAREDGTTAVFSVDRGEQYGKDEFPTLAVYGNTAGSELRLITCDGFDPATGSFDDNYVVYASLSS